MPQQVLDVPELVGQNRNRTYGQHPDRPMAPYRVYNLVPDRQGGYTPYGRRARLQHQEADVFIDDITRLIGYDQLGISSYRQNATELASFRLFKDDIVHIASPFEYQFFRANEAVHIEGAGAYLDRNAYYVLNIDDAPMQPIMAEFAAEADAVPETGVGEISGIGNVLDIEFGGPSNDTFIMVTAGGYIARSTDGGATWSDEAIDTGISFNCVIYANGRWIISTATGIAYYSTDNGITWTQSNINGSGLFVGSVSYLGGNNLAAAGVRVWISTDLGDTWTDEGQVGTSTIYRLAADRSYPVGQPFTIRSVTHSTTGSGGTQGRLVVNLDTANMASPTITDYEITTFGRAANPGTVWVESNNADRWVAVNGRPPGQGGHGQVYTTDNPSNTQANWTATNLEGTLFKVKFNPVRNLWVIVGEHNSEPRVWQSANGQTWTRVTEIEDAIFEEFGSGAFYSVAFDAEGNAIYVGSLGRYATSGSQIALRRGTYNVYFVMYFNTRAGRFVCAFDRQSLTLDQPFGNLITLSTVSRATLLDQFLWLTPEVAETLRFDVYVQYLPEGGDVERDEEGISSLRAETTIRYAFTEEFPETGEFLVPLGRDLEALPLGRQLVTSGAATTAVFEKSRTAIHNGRVWGMANQSEDNWASGDGISPEIANQSNRFVLCYTETGWANLISDQNYIPIQPTQSEEFTGLLSTPSGLMVMFDNEIFLVSGDPAFGNLSVELYLDMAGCDEGATACKIGGLPFVIWDGKVWVLEAGQANEISRDQWSPLDPFVRIAPEPNSRSILVTTQGGVVYRYIVDDGFWLTDPVNRDDEPILETLPAPNVRFVQADGAVWTVERDGKPDVPHVVYRDMDFGFPERRTPLYVIRMGLEGPLAAAVYDRSDVSYDADDVPALFYTSGASTNGSTYETLNELPSGGIPSRMETLGNRDVGVLGWKMPLRSTRSFTIDVRLELRGMDYADTARLPLRFTFAAGGDFR